MKALLALFATLLFFSACKKDVDALPPETSTGANTFGVKVNGKLWVPQGFGIVPTAPILEAHYTPGWSVEINARNFASSPKESEFHIQLKNVTAPGTYLLNAASGNSAYYVERKLTPTGEWRTNNQYGGKVMITVTDTVNRIIAGTFAFQAASLYDDAPVQITEGRFDIKME